MRVVDLIDITLNDSDIPENYYEGGAITKWTAGSYSIGDIRYYDGVTPHMVYESLENSNTATPGTDPLKWDEIGTTDRYAMFDEFINTESAYSEEFEVEIDSSDTNTVGLFGLQAQTIELTQLIDVDILTDGDCSSDSFTDGDGFSYDSGNEQYDCDGSQAAESKLYQEPTTIYTAGDLFQAIIVISNYSAGTVAGLAAGGTSGEFDANGTHTVNVTSSTGSDFGCVVSADFVGSIDSIEIKYIAKYEEIDLDRSVVVDWPSYFFAEQEYAEGVVWEYPQYHYAALKAKITWKTGEDAECGVMAIGRSIELGKTTKDIVLGINSYAKVETDTRGRTSFSSGSKTSKITINAWFYTNQLTSIQKTLKRLTDQLVIFDGNNDGLGYEAITVFGFFKNSEITIRGITESRLSLLVNEVT